MRQRLAAFLLTTLIWSVPLSAAQAEPTHAEVNQALADGVIMPAYERYHAGMQRLAPAMDDLCAKPNGQTLAAARGAFKASADAWQRLQPVAFGPIEDQGLAARIHFWPDKHGTAGRQLSRLLAKPVPEALAEGVAGKSAALQSLSALERVLFDQADKLLTKDGAFACGLVSAIADFQESLAGEVLDAWQDEDGQYEKFTNTAGGNDVYYDPADAATDLFGAIAASLDGIIGNKLERPLGKSLDGAKPKRAEDWRSDRSTDNIVANLETIEALYIEPGGLNVWLPTKGLAALDGTIRKGLIQTVRTARSIDLPLHEAVEDEAVRPQVEQLLQEVKLLRALFTGTLADAAGLTIGFNKSDGD